jgi:hypothetical protein
MGFIPYQQYPAISLGQFCDLTGINLLVPFLFTSLFGLGFGLVLFKSPALFLFGELPKFSLAPRFEAWCVIYDMRRDHGHNDGLRRTSFIDKDGHVSPGLAHLSIFMA